MADHTTTRAVQMMTDREVEEVFAQTQIQSTDVCRSWNVDCTVSEGHLRGSSYSEQKTHAAAGDEIWRQCGHCDFGTLLEVMSRSCKLEGTFDTQLINPFKILKGRSGGQFQVTDAELRINYPSYRKANITHSRNRKVVIKKTVRTKEFYSSEDLTMFLPDGSSRSPDKMSVRGFIFELRVLSHSPLRSHPNIVKLVSLGWEFDAQCQPDPRIILEHAQEGDLRNFLNNNPELPWTSKRSICRDVGRGLQAIHACGIIHRDIKIDNILIFRKGPYDEFVAKVADFGSSFIKTPEIISFPICTVPYAGPNYASRMDGLGFVQADIYSYGILLLIVFLGYDPLLAFVQNKPHGKHFEKYSKLDETREKTLEALKDDGIFGDAALQLLKKEMGLHDVAFFGQEKIWKALSLALAPDRFLRDLDTIVTLQEEQHTHPKPQASLLEEINPAQLTVPYAALDKSGHNVHSQVFQTLARISQDNTDHRQSNACFHLAVCYLAKFGTPADLSDDERKLRVSSNLIKSVTLRDGSDLTFRELMLNKIHSAIGLSLPEDVQLKLQNWCSQDVKLCLALPRTELRTIFSPSAFDMVMKEGFSSLMTTNDTYQTHTSIEQQQVYEACLTGNSSLLYSIFENSPESIRDFRTVNMENVLHFLHMFDTGFVQDITQRLSRFQTLLNVNAANFSVSLFEPAPTLSGCPITRAVGYGNIVAVKALCDICEKSHTTTYSEALPQSCELCFSEVAMKKALGWATMLHHYEIFEILLNHTTRTCATFNIREVFLSIGGEIFTGDLVEVMSHGFVVRNARASTFTWDLPEVFLRACLHGASYEAVIPSMVTQLNKQGMFLSERTKDEAMRMKGYLQFASLLGNLDAFRALHKLHTNVLSETLPSINHFRSTKSSNHEASHTDSYEGFQEAYSFATPLTKAIEFGRREIFEYILEDYKNDLNTPCRPFLLQLIDFIKDLPDEGDRVSASHLWQFRAHWFGGNLFVQDPEPVTKLRQHMRMFMAPISRGLPFPWNYSKSCFNPDKDKDKALTFAGSMGYPNVEVDLLLYYLGTCASSSHCDIYFTQRLLDLKGENIWLQNKSPQPRIVGSAFSPLLLSLQHNSYGVFKLLLAKGGANITKEIVVAGPPLIPHYIIEDRYYYEPNYDTVLVKAIELSDTWSSSSGKQLPDSLRLMLLQNKDSSIDRYTLSGLIKSKLRHGQNSDMRNLIDLVWTYISHDNLIQKNTTNTVTINTDRFITIFSNISRTREVLRVDAFMAMRDGRKFNLLSSAALACDDVAIDYLLKHKFPINGSFSDYIWHNTAWDCLAQRLSAKRYFPWMLWDHESDELNRLLSDMEGRGAVASFRWHLETRPLIILLFGAVVSLIIVCRKRMKDGQLVTPALILFFTAVTLMMWCFFGLKAACRDLKHCWRNRPSLIIRRMFIFDFWFTLWILWQSRRNKRKQGTHKDREALEDIEIVRLNSLEH